MKKKRVTMTLTVSVPADMPAFDARREVRCLITNQCNWAADPDDVRVVKLVPVASPRALRPRNRRAS